MSAPRRERPDVALSRLPPPVADALERLPGPLHSHVQRVRGIVGEMARALALDADRLDLAAAAHDIDRATPGALLLDQARRYGLAVTPVDAAVPMLLHGPVAAARLRAEMGVTDEAVLEAVRAHTTGSFPCGPLAQALFIADKLDPAKAARYPHIDRVRDHAAVGELERAMLAFLDGDLLRLVGDSELVHVASVEARNGLLHHLASPQSAVGLPA